MMAQALGVSQFTEAIAAQPGHTAQGVPTAADEGDFQVVLQQATDHRTADLAVAVPIILGQAVTPQRVTGDSGMKLDGDAAQTDLAVLPSLSELRSLVPLHVGKPNGTAPLLMKDQDLSASLPFESAPPLGEPSTTIGAHCAVMPAGLKMSTLPAASPLTASALGDKTPPPSSAISVATPLDSVNFSEESSPIAALNQKTMGPLAPVIEERSVSTIADSQTMMARPFTPVQEVEVQKVSVPVEKDAAVKSTAAGGTPLSKTVASHSTSSTAKHVKITDAVAVAVAPVSIVTGGAASLAVIPVLPIAHEAIMDLNPEAGSLAVVGVSATPISATGRPAQSAAVSAKVAEQKSGPSLGDPAATSGLSLSPVVVIDERLGAAGTAIPGEARLASAAVAQGTLGSVDGSNSAGAWSAMALVAPATHAAPAAVVSSLVTAAQSASVTGPSSGVQPQTEAMTGSLPHTMLSATPTAIEVGVSGGSHGWLKIRAELNGAGAVNASLTGASSASASALRNELPALSSYLETEKIQVGGLAVHAAVSAMAVNVQEPASASTGSAFASFAGQGDLAGGMGGRTAQEQASREGAQTTATSSSVTGSEDAAKLPLAALSDAGVYGRGIGLGGNGSLSPVEYGVGGSWLNVRA